ncbi:MAG: hypothetical protein WB392_10555 [Methanotrichaceae archaeon]
MERLATAGWDGPEYVGDGKYRYSKCSGWIRLYIDIGDAGFYGGVTGTDSDFEVVFADGKWKRFCTEPAQVNGEPMLMLIEYSTLDLILTRVGSGMPIDAQIDTIDELATYLERCVDLARIFVDNS